MSRILAIFILSCIVTTAFTLSMFVINDKIGRGAIYEIETVAPDTVMIYYYQIDGTYYSKPGSIIYILEKDSL